MTIRDWERIISHVKKMISKEDSHLDFLYEERIRLLNIKNGKTIFTRSSSKALDVVELLISKSEDSLDYYTYKLKEYEEYVITLKNHKNSDLHE